MSCSVIALLCTQIYKFSLSTLPCDLKKGAKRIIFGDYERFFCENYLVNGKIHIFAFEKKPLLK